MNLEREPFSIWRPFRRRRWIAADPAGRVTYHANYGAAVCALMTPQTLHGPPVATREEDRGAWETARPPYLSPGGPNVAETPTDAAGNPTYAKRLTIRSLTGGQ